MPSNNNETSFWDSQKREPFIYPLSFLDKLPHFKDFL